MCSAVETAKGIRHTMHMDMLAGLINYQKDHPDVFTLDLKKVPDKAVVAMHHKEDVEDDLKYSVMDHGADMTANVKLIIEDKLKQ